MKSKLIAVALIVSVMTMAPAWAGGHHGGGGGFAGAGFSGARAGGGPAFSSVRSFGGGPSFHSIPTRSFGGNRMIYSGQHFSSVGRRVPGTMEFRPGHFGQANLNHSAARLNNRGNQSLANVRAGRTSQFRTGSGTLRADWQKHVFAQRSANWHHDWSRSRDHWWHGHRCHFFNGSWIIFDAGFDPWWPWWGYPYDYYGYGYGYPYSYSYGYHPEYYQGGESYDQGNYPDQSDDSTIAAVQQRLASEGDYRGQIDGTFGPETRAAIAEYQSKHGLRVTGGLTNETLAALGLRRVASY